MIAVKCSYGRLEMVSILIVEDAEGSLESIKDALYDPKLAVIGEAHDGIEAIQRYKQLRPDVVLMDIVLPKMDGLTAIKKIIDFDPEADIIAISALYKTDQINNVLSAGAKDYLIKPFSINDLVGTIEKILSRSKHTEIK